jgi:hypothetical protein
VVLPRLSICPVWAPLNVIRGLLQQRSPLPPRFP